MGKRKVTEVEHPKRSAPGVLTDLGGSAFDAFNTFVANGAVRSLWMGHKDEAERDELITAAMSALVGIKPADELEGMLAAQLVATHASAMECYRRAMIPDQTFEGRQSALSQGGKLSRTHAQLLDALNRHRGRGAQRIVVERVDVQSGGQAIVGAVTTEGAGSTRKSKDQPHAQAEANAPEPPVRSANTARNAVSGARGAGEEPLSDAWRGRGKRCA